MRQSEHHADPKAGKVHHSGCYVVRLFRWGQPNQGWFGARSTDGRQRSRPIETHQHSTRPDGTGYTVAIEPSGREMLVVVVKGTFGFRTDRRNRCDFDDEQLPLTMSDVFFGEPGCSAPKYEVDFVAAQAQLRRPVERPAHTRPQGGRRTRYPGRLQIGTWSKSFAVVGDRIWVLGCWACGRRLTGTFEKYADHLRSRVRRDRRQVTPIRPSTLHS